MVRLLDDGTFMMDTLLRLFYLHIVFYEYASAGRAMLFSFLLCIIQFRAFLDEHRLWA
jgi:hypothetical protein